jgi:outer membrane protein assembly factor BamD
MAFDHTGARLTRLAGPTFAHDSGERCLAPWRRPLAQLCAIVLLAAAAACSSAPKKPPVGTPEPDKFLFDRGSETLTQKKWIVSREYFRQLVDGYPQSRYRADAKLGVGDTYLGEGSAESYVLAANEFREFLNFYPTHPRADYAQYKLGMSHFYQMHGPERDQTETKEAIAELSSFVERFPNSSLMPEVKAKLRAAKDRLGESEYRVGFFYFRSRWYPGAIDRFKALLQRDAEYTHRDAVYYYLAESLIKIQRPAEALPYFERLLSEFEQSEFLEDARKRVDELKPKTTGS